MFKLPKTVLSFGAGALAFGTLLLSVPRAAHAVAATLVQVTNTWVSPVVAQDVSKLASQQITLVSIDGQVLPNGQVVLAQMAPTGALATQQFIVPTGQSLVVTAVDVLPNSPASGTNGVALGNYVNGRTLASFVVSNSLSSTVEFPNGFVYPAGESVTVSSGIHSAGPVVFTVHGYLTSN